jgi:hypothetical protein
MVWFFKEFYGILTMFLGKNIWKRDLNGSAKEVWWIKN